MQRTDAGTEPIICLPASCLWQLSPRPCLTNQVGVFCLPVRPEVGRKVVA
jgi:hypothetical protein